MHLSYTDFFVQDIRCLDIRVHIPPEVTTLVIVLLSFLR